MIGHRIHHALKITQDDCLYIKSYKKKKNSIGNSVKGKKHCDKIISENFKIGNKSQEKKQVERKAHI